MSDRLTGLQERFAFEYALGEAAGNGAECAKRAGSRAKDLTSAGSQLLEDARVVARIAQLRDKLAEKTAITQARVLQELSAIAFAKLSDICSWDDSDVTLKSSSELSEATLAAVGKVKRRCNQFGVNVDVELLSKQAALDSIARHLGMFPNKLDVNFSEDRARRIINALAEILARYVPDQATKAAIFAELASLERDA